MMKKRSLLLIAVLTFASVSAKFAPNYGSTITLGGSTLATPYMQAVIALYNSIFPCPKIVYKQTIGFTGSGAGRADVYAGLLNASISDSPAPTTETTNLPDCFLQIPFILSSVSIVMNPPATVTTTNNVSLTVYPNEINFTAADLCKIFTAPHGSPEIWETYLGNSYNQFASQILTSTTPIVTFARSDASGTSATFTSYLATCGPCAGVTANTQNVLPTVFPNALGVNGTLAMLAAVKATANSIGYAGTGDNLATVPPLAVAGLLAST